MANILYISDLNSSEPIFHSQVIPHVGALRKENSVLLLGMERGDSYSYQFSYKSIKGDYFYFIAYLIFLLQYTKLEKFVRENDFNIIYSRGLRGGLLGYFIKKFIFRDQIKLINDVRGDIIDENRDQRLIVINFKYVLKRIFKKSDCIFFVSSYLRDKYITLLNYKGETAICPTFVPDNKFDFSTEIRNKTRKELGLKEEDIVLIYAGNMAKWQNVDVILEAFKSTTNPRLKFLFLTRDERAFKAVEDHNNKDRIIIRSVDYSIIQNFYFAADYGLLVRDDIPTNNCSAPTKFSEYINSGLPIITTKIKSDYCTFLMDNGMEKYMIDKKDDLTILFNRLSTPRRNSAQVNRLSDIVRIQMPHLNDIQDFSYV